MGTKSKKKAKTRLDAYYRLAKDQGYRARSAFKLIQLNRKYDFLGKARVLVDLCAAPGGWCQVAAKHMPIGSKIVGVDLVPIAPIRGVKTFVGDITDDKTRKIILTWLKKELVDCVIHDGAPNVGGVWSRDLFDQNSLVLHSVKLATSLLRSGGWFITKVFRSQDFQKLMWVFKQFFEKVEATKPLASRMESAEIFVVCAGYKAPKHIDPKMFSPQAIFEDVGEEKVVSPSGILVAPHSKTPMGYEDFSTVSHRVGTMSAFIASQDPKEFLKTYHEIRFPEDDRHYLKSRWSRKELVYLCQDLQQVGEADRRRLIRWREQLIREQAKIMKAEQDNAEEEESDEDDDVSSNGAAGGSQENDDDANDVRSMAMELLEIRKRKEKEAKKKQKKIVDRKIKQVKGLIGYDPTLSSQHLTEVDGFGKGDDTVAEEEGGVEGEGVANTDWTIASVQVVSEKKMASAFDKHYVESAGYDKTCFEGMNSVNIANDEDFDMGDDVVEDEDDGDYTHVGQSLRVVEGQEEEFDVDNYGNYVPVERSARVQIFDTNGADAVDSDNDEAPEERRKRIRQEKNAAVLDAAGKQSKWQRRAVNIDQVLNQTFPKPKDSTKVLKSRKEEQLVELKAVAADSSSALLLTSGGKSSAAKKRTRFDGDVGAEDEADFSTDDEDSANQFSDDDYDDDSDISDDLHEEEDLEVNEGRQYSRRKKAIVGDIGKLTTLELVKQQRKQVMKDNREIEKVKKSQHGKKKRTSTKEKKDDNTFEEIPIAMTDPIVRARTLAIGTKMLDKKSRREMLENSVNKYMNNDDDDLPDWFIKDEQRNCKIYLPVTIDDIEAERNRFRELNARPSKKVMEAMGRKRRRAQKMLKGLVEKGKSDPRAREKANKTSVRTLLRSQAIKGKGGKKRGPLDSMSMGQKRRERQKAKKLKKK
eukprot:Tbor_TRINITY_DN2317_c0_g1::TRINITY_DN2317_c0_g1_i1::g.153::m.153/K14857/SPB1, FTSJ3; AdoMet-dependent rRNA methyltransferase SPB1